VSAAEESSGSLYDTRRDYRERSPLENAELARDLRREFYYIYSDSVRRREEIEVREAELSDETVEKLRSLGYVD
jgi:hypothetical protein